MKNVCTKKVKLISVKIEILNSVLVKVVIYDKKKMNIRLYFKRNISFKSILFNLLHLNT